MIALYIVLGVLAVLIAVLLIRTAAFKPAKAEKPVPTAVDVNEAEITEHLSELIRCKTVSHRDEAMVDPAEFDKFRARLAELYPTVHERCTLKRIGPSGMLFHLKGKSSAEPSVFMSHYDVVPANEEAWEKPAFEGVVEDGVLWGRGTLDTKITLLGVMESAEALLKGGFVPENDMYFSFSGDEEIAGPSAPAIVDYLEENGIVPAFVLDEGGAVVEKVFPGVSAPCALIGTGEKGMTDIEFSIKSNGGHASTPPPHTILGKLAAACVKAEAKPLPLALPSLWQRCTTPSAVTPRLYTA